MKTHSDIFTQKSHHKKKTKRTSWKCHHLSAILFNLTSSNLWIVLPDAFSEQPTCLHTHGTSARFSHQVAPKVSLEKTLVWKNLQKTPTESSPSHQLAPVEVSLFKSHLVPKPKNLQPTLPRFWEQQGCRGDCCDQSCWHFGSSLGPSWSFRSSDPGGRCGVETWQDVVMLWCFP